MSQTPASPSLLVEALEEVDVVNFSCSTAEIEAGNFTLLNSNGTIGGFKNPELESVLTPLLLEMKAAEAKEEGAGIYPLRRFLHRLHNAGIIMLKDVEAETVIAAPDALAPYVRG